MKSLVSSHSGLEYSGFPFSAAPYLVRLSPSHTPLFISPTLEILGLRGMGKFRGPVTRGILL